MHLILQCHFPSLVVTNTEAGPISWSLTTSGPLSNLSMGSPVAHFRRFNFRMAQFNASWPLTNGFLLLFSSVFLWFSFHFSWAFYFNMCSVMSDYLFFERSQKVKSETPMSSLITEQSLAVILLNTKKKKHTKSNESEQARVAYVR